LVGFDAGSMTTGGVSRTQTDSVSFTSSATAIMTYNATSYRSAELFVTVTDAANTEYSCMKANVIHDGTTAYISVYGIVNTGTSDTANINCHIQWWYSDGICCQHRWYKLGTGTILIAGCIT
jgi:hypothetical protein